MSIESLNEMISRAATDLGFRELLLSDPQRAAESYDVSGPEMVLLKRVTAEKLDHVLDKLDEWNQPAAAASMELMFLFFGEELADEKAARKVKQPKKPKPAKGPQAPRTAASAAPARKRRRPLLLFAGVAAVGLVLAVALLLVLGQRRQNVSPVTATEPPAAVEGRSCGELCSDTVKCAEGLACVNGECFSEAVCGTATPPPGSELCECVCETRNGLEFCSDCEGNRCMP